MKNFKISIAWLAMFALIFTSCSKEETDVMPDDQENIQITFGSILNDFQNDNRQSDPGECNEGDPAYVWVAITDENGDYIGEDDGDDNPNVNFIEVGLNWNSSMGVYETMYSDDLALPAGDYHLQHFVVYDSNHDVVWVAPREEGEYSSSVANPLPELIELEAGTKPYITVDVLCYITRNEEAYGYLFFDINLTEVENNYCLFVNFCDEATGRDYPAYFSVDVWTDGYGVGTQIIDGETNTIDDSGTWPAGSVLCLPLPELEGDDTFFVTVTVMNHGDLDYTTDGTDVRNFEISQADIDGQLNEVPRYEHVRFECGEDPGNGGETPPPSDCVDAPGSGCDQIVITDETVSLSGVPAGELPTVPVFWNDSVIGYVEFDYNNGDLSADFDLNEGYVVTDVEIILDEVGGEALTTPVPLCIQDISENAYTLSWELNIDAQDVFPIVVDFVMNVCTTD